MEKNFYNDEFEQLLKEKSDGFRMYPSKRVWHSIYNDLHPGRKWPSVAVSLVLIIALLMVGYWNNKSTPVTIANTTQKNIPATTQSQFAANNGSINNTAQQSNTTAATNTVASSANTPIAEQGHRGFVNVLVRQDPLNGIVGGIDDHAFRARLPHGPLELFTEHVDTRRLETRGDVAQPLWR